MIDYKIISLEPEHDPDDPAMYTEYPFVRYVYRIVLTSTLYPESITGIERLKQRIYTVMMGSPGSDIWDPEKGGGLIDLSKRPFNPYTIKSQLAIIVSRTSDQIKDEQRDQVLPDEERLIELELREINVGNRILKPIEVDKDRMSVTLRPFVRTVGPVDYFELGLSLGLL